MMSNSPSSLHTRQGLHRRQNSTPLALEAMKVQHPTTIQRQISPHRRGQSYDLRRPGRRQHQQNQPGSMVSITNIGSTPHGQHILREAQQQRISRPGQLLPFELPVSPQCGTYQSMSDMSNSSSPYNEMTINAFMHNISSMPMHPQFHQDMGLSMSEGASMSFDLDENNQYFHHSHSPAVNMGAVHINDRRMSQPELRIYTGMRPLTPEQHNQISQFPLTPASTPYNTHNGQFTRSLQTSPIEGDMQSAIRSPRPISMQKSRSLQGITEQDEVDLYPAQPEVADMPLSHALNRKKTLKRGDSEPEVVPTRANNKTPTQQSPLLAEDDDEPTLNKKPVPILTSNHAPGSLSPSRPALSPRRMSISDLNLEPGISASIEETNVTLDDIAQFIEGPDPVDNKYICKYEDCDKRFGRKENIKSHVQTHLGDRQFRCDHCSKCFVRGHDLKRHAKIHTGTKPYPCLCGNAFARHDALTRHRQRGMCIGAFDGIVKKVIKRGRPRKHRPEMDERVDKAARTRHNKANSESGFDQYASSSSSCSMSSWGSPPTETMDHLSIRGQSPYDDIEFFGLHHASQNIDEAIGLPPNMFSFTPPASPGYSTGNRPSPSYREQTPTDLASIAGDMSQTMTRSGSRIMPTIDELPSLDTMEQLLTANPMAVQHSQQSLPGLSHSSSSPIADVAAYDFGSDDPSLGSLSGISMSMGLGHKIDGMGGQHERNEFDSFLDFNGIEMGIDGNNIDPFFTI